jgi:hypothetical protein
MNSHYEVFIASIHSKNTIKIIFDSKEKGIIERKCIPFDYGLSTRYKDGLERFHLYDLDSPKGNHTLSILPNQIIELSLLDEIFEPADYVKWVPKWIVVRDWGIHS